MILHIRCGAVWFSASSFIYTHNSAKATERGKEEERKTERKINRGVCVCVWFFSLIFVLLHLLLIIRSFSFFTLFSQGTSVYNVHFGRRFFFHKPTHTPNQISFVFICLFLLLSLIFFSSFSFFFLVPHAQCALMRYIVIFEALRCCCLCSRLCLFIIFIAHSHVVFLRSIFYIYFFLVVFWFSYTSWALQNFTLICRFTVCCMH